MDTVLVWVLIIGVLGLLSWGRKYLREQAYRRSPVMPGPLPGSVVTRRGPVGLEPEELLSIGESPQGMGYRQGALASVHSSPLLVIGTNRRVAAIDDGNQVAYWVGWERIEGYWHGSMTFPESFAERRGEGIVLRIRPSALDGDDLVIRPYDVEAWLETLQRKAIPRQEGW